MSIDTAVKIAVKIIRVVNPGWIVTQTPNANRAPPSNVQCCPGEMDRLSHMTDWTLWMKY